MKFKRKLKPVASSRKSSDRPKKSLYFIAVLPDEKFLNQVLEIKKYIQERYFSSHALRSPGHITLHMPFKWREDRAGMLVKTLAKFVEGRAKFEVNLNGFQAFAPKVIYINVEENEELSDLYADLGKIARVKLKLLNADFKGRGFNPHMTVAFRDLKPAIFKQAWSEFETREIKHAFEVSSVVLLKHNGINWDVFRKFEF